MADNNKNTLLGLFQRYWKAYGGCKTFFTSPYTYVSLGLTLLLYPLWKDNSLTDIALNVLPSLLGFTLGGYAMFLAFGDRDFLRILTLATSDGHSIYRSINSTFVHFIVVQIFAVLWSLLAKAYFPLFGSVLLLSEAVLLPGAFLFIYALLLALAVTLNLFRFTTWYETALSKAPQSEQACKYSESEDRRH